MKKTTVILTVLLLTLSMTLFSGCGSTQDDPGAPPPENAVSVRIGRDGETKWAVHMYNNATANTITLL